MTTTITTARDAEFNWADNIGKGARISGCLIRGDGSATLPIVNELGHHLNLPAEFFTIADCAAL